MTKLFWQSVAILSLLLLCLWASSTATAAPAAGDDPADAPAQQTANTYVYLPLVLNQRTAYRVNAPYFDGAIPFAQTAIFWFGRVTPDENYADVRVGYNDDELYVRLAAFDRRLWYDTTSTANELTEWDAATLFINLGSAGSAPDAHTYRFVAQFNWWESRANYQAAYQGDGAGWVAATLPFSTTSGWRGDAPNNDTDDRGWAITFRIPFASLGLTSRPPQRAVWGMAVALHDRDAAAGPPLADKTWPGTISANTPSGWGQLAFGLLAYTPPSATAGGTVAIRHNLDGASVPDAAVGGTIGNLCPGDSYFIWNEWGNANFGSATGFNIQNQSNIDDWPCFAKYYITFPLNSIPSGKVIISATLTLHQFGGSDPSQAQPSLIQVLRAAQAWDDTTITWNNAPLALENVGQAWVDPISFPGWPGVAREWDVSYAAAQAYSAGQPLRLILYEADSDYHSGKHFVSSDTEDWNEAGRPTLRVTWGNP